MEEGKGREKKFIKLVNFIADRSEEKIEMIQKYLAATRQLRDYSDASQDPAFSKVVVLDLDTVVTSVSGPKRPHDRVSVVDMQQDFRSCLTNKVSEIKSNADKGFWYCSPQLVARRLDNREGEAKTGANQ